MMSIESALSNYLVENNRERGWSIEAVTAAFDALSAECKAAGVEMSDVLNPKFPQVEVTGPAQVVSGVGFNGVYSVEVYPCEANLDRSLVAGRGIYCYHTGSKFFDLRGGAVLVDHRPAE